MKTSKSLLKVSDWQLLARLKPFVKPLWPILTLGAVLVFFAALTSVALPYITKMAIDLYILPVGPKVDLPFGKNIPPSLAKIMRSGEITPSGVSGIFFLKPAAVSLLDRHEEKMLIEMGLLSQTRYYVRPLTEADTPQLMELAKKYPELVHIYPTLLAVEEKNLLVIPKSFNLILRQIDLEGLGQLALIFCLLMFMGYIFEFGQRVILEVAAQGMSLNLRQAVLAHLFGLSQSFFDGQQSGKLTSKVTSDINNLSNLTKSSVATLFNDLVSIVVITVIMFILSPTLALITIIFTPLAVMLTIYFGRLSRIIQREMRVKLAVINQSFSDTINGINILQSFRQENRKTCDFIKINDENYLLGMRQIKIHAIFMPLIDVFASIILALVIWFGGGAVLNGTLSLGVVAAFLGYARRYFMPIQDLAEKITIFQSAFASLEHLTELLDVDEKIIESPRRLKPISPGGGLEFRHVNFRYLPDSPLVLKDLSFKISPGESVALAGQTGSGKSSVINLMLRSYDPESGEIFFDGQALKNLDLKSHQARLGLVTQDVYLYGGTVMDNLRLGRQDLSQADLMAAVRAVGADHFIENLPHGYQEPLGPGGRHLSAGERQLLACARAFISAPEIIILDEATAAVDSETEALIEQALHTLFTGRTSIIIAHRLATIRRVDRIMVLHEGRLIEEGGPQELLNRQGAYYNLAKLQGLV